MNSVALKLAKPSTELVAVGIAVLEAAVIKPLAFTVKLGTEVPLPKLPTLLLTVASVPAAVTLPEPSKLGLVYVKSPVMAIVREVANAVAVLALPLSAPNTVVTLRFCLSSSDHQHLCR